MKRTFAVLGVLTAVLMAAAHCGRQVYPESEAYSASMKSPPNPMADAVHRDSLAIAEPEVQGKSTPRLDSKAYRRGEMGSAEASAPAAPAAGPAPMAAMPTGGIDRHLIKTATVAIEVADAREANTKLLAAVQAVGGYVGDYRELVDGLGRRSVMVQIRVPASRFDESMGQLDPLGKVVSKQVSTQDVTEEFVDTDARARNLKATEARLIDHLNRAGKLEDILRIEQEVTRVREEIERLDGRLRFLTDRVQYSTIQITLQEAPKAEPVVPAETFSTAKVVSEAVRSLIGLGQGLWVRAIWLGVWSVVWVPCALAAWLLYRRLRRAFKPVS